MSSTPRSNSFWCGRRHFLACGIAGAAGAATAGLGLRPQRRVPRGQSIPALKTAHLRAMGSTLEVTVPGHLAVAAVPGVFRAIRGVESRMSGFDPNSELSRLNATGCTNAVTVSMELGYLLATCERYHQITDGAFDPTVGPLVQAWGFCSQPARPPRQALRAAFDRVGMDKVQVEGNSVSFFREGMALDLGGIAVGHAVDQAIRSLREGRQRISCGLINAAGDLRAAGPRPDGRPWVIGLKDPTSEDDRAFASVELHGTRALTTSGTYQKFVLDKGRRVSHIFDPRTGDSPGEVVSATVVAGSAVAADALATACVVLGGGEALSLLERIPEVEGLLVLRTPGRRHAIEGTSGIRAKILREV